MNGEWRRQSFKLAGRSLAGQIFGEEVFGVVSGGRMAAVELSIDLLPLRRSGSSLATSESD